MRLPILTNPIPGGTSLRDAFIPGSKSVTNRALLLACLAKGPSRLSAGLEADDTRVMRGCLHTLGVRITEDAAGWTIQGGAAPRPQGILETGASGTTLRFLLPWLALTAQESVRFHGDPRLFERPLGGLVDALRSVGASWEASSAGGILSPAGQAPRRLDLQIDPSASSQFLTGLAMAAAALPEGGRLRWQSAPPSTSYLELTAHWMAAFGCVTELTDRGWDIPGQALQRRTLRIPGDWSGAAAFLCAAAVTGTSVIASPLDPVDPQGDRSIATILQNAGCTIEWVGSDRLRVQGPLARGLEADLALCPDLGPVLAATAALAPAPSVLTGLQTLPLKECDRLEASAELVRWLGGQATIIGNHTLHIHPGPRPETSRPPFDPRNDHRMAFAAAIGGLRCGGELLNPGCVAKTLPTFWDAWNAMLRADQ
jgi:3-phosphoshikimate 1-carboxyvinyltransferase